ncbi:hypothetical protein HNP46_006568 [Pseudomonas nitritireducens]|uniref:SWIM-type domain-containing protein n=1 Tax=Pseudomonas nitroreducens TaxID=46680 RepID=A0A7W7P570_PSENT|nr:SWIM zinc finger family protein [Pseudomonas nitritireducens]MBB4867649.1 hypothetical protein [Pseudomonas nitritireducens]
MSSWRQRYLSYDDNALEVLANAGLLRRAGKDVEAGKLAWLKQSEQGGLIETDGQQVSLDQTGIDAARCTCPATGCCKHILAAVLWLRQQEDEAPAAQAEHEDVNLALNEALALDPQQLQKQAGKVASRKARQWCEELGRADYRSEGRRLVLALPAISCEVLYLAGGGFAGMLSESRENERKGLHLATLALLFQNQERAWTWTDTSETPATDPLRLSQTEAHLLDAIEQLLGELLRQGLSHVSSASAVQLRMLNLSARTEGLPRLAGHLRTLGGQVECLARRDDHSSERESLMQMALVQALCLALRCADETRLPALRGRLRRTYQPGASLDLLPLGAHWWTTPGGARGLTLAFWDSQESEVREVSLARPDGNDTSFQRDSVWAQQSLWKSTPERLCQSPLRLEAPRQADDGRLAANGEGHGHPLPRWPADDPRIDGLGIADWQQLAALFEASATLGADLPTALLLRPSHCEEALLDETRQVLRWTLLDAQNNRLELQLPCTLERRQRLDNLERVQKARDDIRAVLVHPWLDGRRRRLEPLALLIRDKGELRCLSLDFEATMRGGLSLNRRFLERIQRLFERKADAAAFIEPPSLAMRLVEPALDVLESLASCGRRQLSEYQRDTLLHQRSLAESAGVELLAEHLRRLAEAREITPNALLTTSHLMNRLLALDPASISRTARSWKLHRYGESR